jgi:hypothetical protein
VATGGTLADITSDGTADILGAIAGGGTGFQRYEYCGTGCLTPKEVVSGQRVEFVAHFNNDDRDDVLTYDGSLYRVLFGGPTGLSLATAVTVPAITDSAFVFTGDFNGDGNADLVRNGGIAGFPDVLTLTAYLGDGAGHFIASSLVAIATGGELGRTQVEIADVNGDGRDDIVTNFLSDIHVTKLGDPNCGGVAPGTCPYIEAAIPSGLFAFGDIDGDGKDDLARYQFSPSSVDFFRSTGTGFTPFPPFQTISVPVSGTQIQMQLRDIDNDGITDFLLNDHVNTRTWWSGTNDGGFPYEAQTDVPLQATGCDHCFGDVNNDGRVDAIVNGQLWFSTSEDTSG